MARILVVDDESNIRMMLRLALTHVGHTVDTAPDGFEGLEKFDTGKTVDLVLLDQRMPGMDGLQVLRAMRQIRPQTRVVMITAFGTFDLANEAFDAGAVNFLRKPFTVDTLRNAVDAALSGESEKTELPRPSGGDDPMPLTFDRTAVNGFRLMSTPGVQTEKNGTISDVFTVREANGAENDCRVSLPPFVVELVKAYADRDDLPGGEQFWQALCGESLANYLWQNAELPPGGLLQVDDLPSGLKHWMDGVFHGVGGPK